MSANKFQFTYPILALSHIQKFAIFTSIFIKLVILFDQLTSQACCCCERKGKEGKKKERKKGRKKERKKERKEIKKRNCNVQYATPCVSNFIISTYL